MSTIIYSKQGSGKSTQTEKLAKRFGATVILDEWAPGDPLPEGALALTNVPHPEAMPNEAVVDNPEYAAWRESQGALNSL